MRFAFLLDRTPAEFGERVCIFGGELFEKYGRVVLEVVIPEFAIPVDARQVIVAVNTPYDVGRTIAGSAIGQIVATGDKDRSELTVTCEERFDAEMQGWWEKLATHLRSRGWTLTEPGDATSPTREQHPEIRERRERVLEMWKDGLPDEEIAHALDVSSSTIKRDRAALGLKSK